MTMRFTVVDAAGTISFTGPGHLLKMLTASVHPESTSTRDLLEQLEELDASQTDDVRRGLAVFDEHCLRERPETIEAWTADRERLSARPFRVVDQVTRNASLQPDRLGLAIFNLNERRIVQVQNSYGALLRCDRGRIRKDGRPTSRFYHYNLADDWSIVP